MQNSIIFHVLYFQVTDGCKVVPLLMLHGFPGSVREFYRALPLLTAGCHNGIALEVIAPSLPGFGYSDVSIINNNNIWVYHTNLSICGKWMRCALIR